MKICLINNLYKPYAKGGAEKVVEMTARGLQEQGHEVSIITTSPAISNQSRVIDGMKVYYVWSPNLVFYGNLGKLPMPFRLIWHFLDTFNFVAAHQVRKIIKHEKPEVTFLHNLKGLSYLIPKFLRNENLVFVPHDVQLVEPSGIIYLQRDGVTQLKMKRCLSGPKHFGRFGPILCLGLNLGPTLSIYTAINRFLFSDIKKVISPSKWLLNFYNDHGFFKKARQTVLHNPTVVEPETLLDGPEAPWALRAQHTLRTQNEIMNLLFVGQLEESKGIIFLIKTLKNFKFQISNFKFNLTIVGDGSRRKEIISLIQDDKRFKYLEKLDSEELHKAYQEADYTIVPSLIQENCPTVILESWACGTPVIASRAGGIPELVSNLLFNPGDAKDLKRILQDLPKIDWLKLSQEARASAKIHAIDRYINLLINFSHQEDGQNALEREPCQMCQ